MLILKAENTEKASHNVKPRLPGKMCTLTPVVQSRVSMLHTGQTMQILVNTIRHSGLVGVCSFSARGLCSTEHSSLEIVT